MDDLDFYKRLRDFVETMKYENTLEDTDEANTLIEELEFRIKCIEEGIQ